MKIFLVLHPSINASFPGSMTWYRNLYEPLLDLVHHVCLLRIDEAEGKLGVNRKSESFQAKIQPVLTKHVPGGTYKKAV
jgi:hypothetical protein